MKTAGVLLKKNIFKYWGGKQRICDWVISHFPEDYEKRIYIEPFCGSAIILLNKYPSRKEYISDLDKNLFYLYRAIREEPAKFVRLLNNTLYSVNELNYACDVLDNPPDDWLICAWAKFVSLSMSFLCTGKRGALACSKARSFAKLFRSNYGRIDDIRDRLKYVEVLNKDALTVIDQFDGPDVFFYLDPPYPDTSQEPYAGAYTLDDFNVLTKRLSEIKGRYLISFEKKEGMFLPGRMMSQVIARSSKNGINNIIRGDEERLTAEETLMCNYPGRQQFSMGDL